MTWAQDRERVFQAVDLSDSLRKAKVRWCGIERACVPVRVPAHVPAHVPLKQHPPAYDLPPSDGRLCLHLDLPHLVGN